METDRGHGVHVIQVYVVKGKYCVEIIKNWKILRIGMLISCKGIITEEALLLWTNNWSLQCECGHVFAVENCGGVEHGG
jgi:hypothetical protein